MSSIADGHLPHVGVVAIGRNEGERLRRCLDSVMAQASRVVYVDSGSTDGSVAMARRRGVMVVELDRSAPFTAARARNAGFEQLRLAEGGVQFVQFVDGDCEVRAGWLKTAAETLRGNAKLAAVCGRRRERHPEASVYNRLCDIEWDTKVGNTSTFGGDVVVRASVFRELGGYNAAVIAGEDPELSVRVLRAGWLIERLDEEMTWHDAAIMCFGQWWRRNARAGHAYAEGAAMHGATPARHCVHEARSNWVWGLFVPAAALAGAWWTWGGSLLLLGLYGVLYWRVRCHALQRGLPTGDAKSVAWFTMLGKFPQALGQLAYWRNRLTGRCGGIIEYKDSGADASAAGQRTAAP